MPDVLRNRVKETTTTTGTGTITLNGAYSGGFFAFYDATESPVGSTFPYVITDAAESFCEFGTGELLTETTMSRTPHADSHGGSPVDLPAGTYIVFMSPLADWLENLNTGPVAASRLTGTIAFARLPDLSGTYSTLANVTNSIASALTPYSTTAQINTALSFYSTITARDTAISAALVPYTNTTGMNSAIASALTPYSTTIQIAATYSTPASVTTQINTALTPYSTSSQISTLLASYATLAGTETLLNKTLTTPVIASFVSATHDHTNNAGGGTLVTSAIVSGTFSGARGGLGADASAFTGLLKMASGVASVATADTDYVTPTGSVTLTNKTLTTPTIGSFVNATHTHQNAAGGGQLNASSVFSAGTVPLARGGTNVDLSAGGGTGFVLKQAAGGVISSATLVAADIPALSYVTSVGLTLPSELTVSGSPVTSSGSLAATWANQTTGKFFAAPNGSTGTPTFRAIASADLTTALTTPPAIGGTTPAAVSSTIFTAKHTTDSAPLGAELLTNGTFTTSLTPWTGANWSASSNTALHTVGSTAALTQTGIATTINRAYAVVVTVSGRTAGSVTPAIGATSGTAISTNTTSTQYLYAASTASVSVTLTPSTDFDGSVDDVSVKLVGVWVTPSSLLSSAGAAVLEFRANATNFFAGLNAGQYLTTGANNVGLGPGALANVTTAIRNVAVGTNALTALRTGTENVAVGFDALAAATITVATVAVGRGAAAAASTGDGNVYVGDFAANSATGGGDNVYLGRQAGRFAGSASGGIFLGNYAGYLETNSNRLVIWNAISASQADGQARSIIYGVMASTAAAQSLQFNVGSHGFFGGTPASKPAITGSRGGNAALASLLTGLASMSLITDSTTA